MAFATPPTYRIRKAKPVASYNPPNRGTTGTTATTVPVGRRTTPLESGRTVGVAAPTGNPFQNPSAPAPAAPAATPAASSPATPTAPPETLAGLNLRVGGREDYGVTMADINRRLLQAALDYGGVSQVEQAGYNGDQDVVNFSPVAANSPNSRLATIGRGLVDTTRGIGEDLNNRNSFFSGAHLEQQGRADDQAGRDRQQALTDYQRAEAELMNALAQARSSRDESMRQAVLADIAAAASTTPQATAEPPGAGTPGGRPLTPEEMAYIAAANAAPADRGTTGTVATTDPNLLRRRR